MDLLLFYFLQACLKMNSHCLRCFLSCRSTRLRFRKNNFEFKVKKTTNIEESFAERGGHSPPVAVLLLPQCQKTRS